jgi:hypothetical protein
MPKVFTKPKTITLATIADGMRSDIGGQITWTTRKLTGGLEILLQRIDACAFRLAVAREVTPPSATELRLLLKAFALPESTQWHHKITNRKKRKPDGSQLIYLNPLHVAECTWRTDAT